MAKYAIWNKKDTIITPIGEVLTPEQWIERFPVAGIDSIKVVCGGGEINGAIFSTMGQMKERYGKYIDFSAYETDQEILDAIEAFEDEMNKPSTAPSAEERIAAALEYQVMSSLPDVDEEV